MSQILVRGFVLAIALLVTGISFLTGGEDAIVYFAPAEAQTGTGTTLALIIETKKPLNVVGGTITFATSSLLVSAIGHQGSFVDLWLTPPRVDSEKGEIPFTGGTSSTTGLTGRGVLFTVNVATTSNDRAELSIQNLEVFGHDGQGTLLTATSRPYVVYDPAPSSTGGVGGSADEGVIDDLRLRSDLNGDGDVTLADLSVLLVKSVAPYEAIYDLNQDGKLGLGDFSALLTVLGNRTSNTAPETP